MYLLKKYNKQTNEDAFLSSDGVTFFSANNWVEGTAKYKAHLFKTLDEAIFWMRKINGTTVVSQESQSGWL